MLIVAVRAHCAPTCAARYGGHESPPFSDTCSKGAVPYGGLLLQRIRVRVTASRTSTVDQSQSGGVAANRSKRMLGCCRSAYILSRFGTKPSRW